jgi:hypothetical protein
MSYKITYTYNWYKTPKDECRYIIKTYRINNIPFTFDELPEIAQNDPEIISQADQQKAITPEIFYQKSFYLIDEEAHPMLFDVELENPEILEEIDN